MVTFLFSFVFCASIAGKANLDKSDLEPALKALKDRLMNKNVVRSLRFSRHYVSPT